LGQYEFVVLTYTLN